MTGHSIIAGLGAGVLVLGITASVGAQGNGQGAERTITVYEKGSRSTFRYVDAKPFTRFTKRGPRKVSAGDSFIITNRLYADAAATAQAAVLHVQCTAMTTSTRFDRVISRCDGSALFADGQIAFDGVANVSKPSFVFPVVGGTGAYEGARGQLSVAQQPNGDSTDTVHLLATK